MAGRFGGPLVFSRDEAGEGLGARCADLRGARSVLSSVSRTVAARRPNRAAQWSLTPTLSHLWAGGRKACAVISILERARAIPEMAARCGKLSSLRVGPSALRRSPQDDRKKDSLGATNERGSGRHLCRQSGGFGVACADLGGALCVRSSARGCSRRDGRIAPRSGPSPPPSPWKGRGGRKARARSHGLSGTAGCVRWFRRSGARCSPRSWLVIFLGRFEDQSPSSTRGAFANGASSPAAEREKVLGSVERYGGALGVLSSARGAAAKSRRKVVPHPHPIRQTSSLRVVPSASLRLPQDDRKRASVRMTETARSG
jgi:hypothetical protein